MPTFGELKDAVIGELHGHTTDVPMMGTLIGSITPDATELALDFGDNPGAGRPNGIVEIDDELLVVTRYDANNGVATVPSWGRGHRGTVAAEHDEGAQVTVRPRYPRKRVGDVINQVIAASCPPLFAAEDLDEFDTGVVVDLGYPLPANTIRVLRVEATDAGMPPELACRRVLDNWTVRHVAGTQLLELPRWEVYQSVQVTVAADPGRLVNDADDFAAVTGLAESAADMVIFGALARLVLGSELARQQVTSVEAAQRNAQIQSGTGTTLSRYFQALYTQRLEFERDRLQQLHPLILLRRG